jgi:hypothetical protein
MSEFSSWLVDILVIQIEDKLGDRASTVDETALVNAYIEKFGFIDVGEADPEEFEALVREHTYPYWRG